MLQPVLIGAQRLRIAVGGYASAEISTSVRQTGAFAIGNLCCEFDIRGSSEKNHQGWTIGGGFAWMFAQNLSFGVDYSYINLGSDLHRVRLTGEACCSFPESISVRADPDDIHKVSARLTFHFNNAPAPVPY
jgi:hypothetical protein